MNDIDLNHAAMLEFMLYTKGELYIKNYEDGMNGLWIVKAEDEYYDEFGILEYPLLHGRIIYAKDFFEIINKNKFSENELKKIKKDNIKNFKNHSNALLKGKLKEITKKEKLRVIDNLQERDDLFLVRHEGEIRILKIIGVYSDNISELINIYNLFSKLEISPEVHAFNLLVQGKPYTGSKMYGYVITDYIPLTLHKIKNKRDKKEAVKQAVFISYIMEDNGYYNIDSHGDNYLWNPINKKVYAIDFTDLVREKTKYNTFDGTIYMGK